MAYTDIVTALALLQFVWFSMQVAKARGKYQVEAPAVSGNEIFERYFRVHMNTLEQLIVFIPSIVLFGRYIEPRIAAALGIVFLIGRALYFRSYVSDPKKRSLGFGLTFLPNAILLVGAVIGAALALR